MVVVKCQSKWIGSLIMQFIPWWLDVTGTIYLLGHHNFFLYWIRILLQFWNNSHLNFIFLSSVPLYMLHRLCEESLTTSTIWKENSLGKKCIWTSSSCGLPSHGLPSNHGLPCNPLAQLLVQGCLFKDVISYLLTGGIQSLSSFLLTFIFLIMSFQWSLEIFASLKKKINIIQKALVQRRLQNK